VLADYGLAQYANACEGFTALKPAKQDQYQKNNDDETEPAAAVIPGPIKWAATTEPAESAKQDDD
jgi:hypothetical protein